VKLGWGEMRWPSADTPRPSIHGLRHTHATLLLRVGVPVKAVSEQLGHAQARITLDVYAHFRNIKQDRAKESIGATLFRQEKP
jgi:integrase